jgi:hypothetical protein
MNKPLVAGSRLAADFTLFLFTFEIRVGKK